MGIQALNEPKVISFEKIRVACKNCSLGTLCLPVGLSNEDVDRLDSIVKRARPLHRGDYLFRSGERFRSLYVVKTGSVKTYAPSEEGGEQVLGFHLPGEVIGLDAIDKEIHFGGVFVTTNAPADLHEEVRIALALPAPIKRTVHAEAIVVKVDDASSKSSESTVTGMGVAFKEPAKVLEKLNRLIERARPKSPN